MRTCHKIKKAPDMPRLSFVDLAVSLLMINYYLLLRDFFSKHYV